jgi:hypothetical protein
MTTLETGITDNGTGEDGVTSNILGQISHPKAVCATTFTF